MCLEEEMPENSIALASPGKEEQALSIPAFLQGHRGVQGRDPAWDGPSGQAAEHLLARGIDKNEATRLPSRGKQIPAVVPEVLKIQSNTGPG